MLPVVWGQSFESRLPRQGERRVNPHSCNCTLKYSKQTHPSTYRGCSQAKEEVLWRKVQKMNVRGNTGQILTTNHVTLGNSFAMAVRGSMQQQQQPQQTTTTDSRS
jgi:hypothetical protein